MNRRRRADGDRRRGRPARRRAIDCWRPHSDRKRIPVGGPSFVRRV